MLAKRLGLYAFLSMVVMTAAGCSSAKMVRSDPNGGVVSIPSNSNSWPMRNRDDAKELMAAQCPDGYDIVEEKQVVVGKKTTTNREVSREPLGAIFDRTTTSTSTSVSDETEWHITFRRKGALPPIQTTSAVMAPTPPPVTKQMPPPAPMTDGLPSRPVPVAQ